TLLGKYTARSRPLIFHCPVPGTTRTRATASLRRPVPPPLLCTAWRLGATGVSVVMVSVTGVPSSALLRDLADDIGDRLLRGVRVLGPGVHLELADLLAAQFVVREHPGHGLLDHAAGVLLQQFTVGGGLQTAR